MLQFPLYHGTSDHYLAAFRPGHAPAGWPHRNAAITLLREVCRALRAHGTEPEWYVVRMLDQTSEHANWQHGELYVTPSKQSAVRYAGAAAAYGGELLNECRSALDRLTEIDRAEAERLYGLAGPVGQFLAGGGKPILVTMTSLGEVDLLPERAIDNVGTMLGRLFDMDDFTREMLGQQMNFRVRSGAGVVARVFALNIEDSGDPVSPYSETEVAASPLWR